MTTKTIGNDGTAQLILQAKQTLDVSDLVLLLGSLEAMYGVLLTYHFLAGVGRERDSPEMLIAEDAVMASMIHLLEGWPVSFQPPPDNLLDPELAERQLRGRVPGELFQRELGGFSRGYPNYSTDRSTHVLGLHRGIYRVIPASTLRVAGIRISSPGPISLQGLGEPLRELREFVKDLWYRNRQEKARGDLELESARLKLQELQRQLGAPSDEAPLNKASIFLSNGAKAINQLSSEGKIDVESLEVKED